MDSIAYLEAEAKVGAVFCTGAATAGSLAANQILAARVAIAVKCISGADTMHREATL